MVDIPQAHARLLTDPTIQFRFPAAPPPLPPPAEMPHVGSPAAIGGWLFWVVVAVAGVVLLAVVVQAIRNRGGPGRRKAAQAPAQVTPAAAALPALPASALADADALAGAGDYGAAVHALLLRGVGAIGQRFPRALVPSHTSRDIAALAVLPPFMRDAFAAIAARTERAVFACRPLDQADWAHCRALYASLLPSPDGVPP